MENLASGSKKTKDSCKPKFIEQNPKKKKEQEQKRKNEPDQQGKKTRRKSRVPNKQSTENLCSYNSKLVASKKPSTSACFSIAPKKNQQGTVYRKRNPNRGCINLDAFNHDSGTSCVFETVISSLTAAVEAISVCDQTPAKKAAKKKKAKKKRAFPEYMTSEEVNEGLKNGTLFYGNVRINPKNHKKSYVGNDDRAKADYIINSVLHRNRALEGDRIVFKLLENSERDIQVVHIVKKVHPRTAVGYLTPINAQFAEFTPRDYRVPKIRIPPISWPSTFAFNPTLYENNLFVAQITDWSEVKHADGLIIENLGIRYDLRVETMAILREFCLNVTPYGSEVEPFLPPSELTEAMLTNREDLRNECIFTIDPSTARDLDDAVSCKLLENGNVEVGVHISDASYFLDEGTILDETVKNRATSTYLVDNVYHMLPVEMCFHCSLLPGKDKLAFSIIWVINSNGDIVNTRMVRSVINSCAQLSYEHAQEMIEDPSKNSTNLPPICNGFTSQHLVEAVTHLQVIAVKLREKRIDNGALRIDQMKISFSLEPTTGQPVNYWLYQQKDAHRLIEEYMLLANISVAQKLLEHYPQEALLRCHEPPKQNMLIELKKYFETVGVFLDISSSGSLMGSLQKYQNSLGMTCGFVLNHLLAKPMVRARYLCAGNADDTCFNHYALSVPVYTHFTSPIRRYADIMVHRYLAACLGYRDKPQYSIDDIVEIAETCNRQKYNAKRAGEVSLELYLATYVEANAPFIEAAVVVDVKDRSADLIILNTGSTVRLYTNNFGKGVTWKPEQIQKNENNEEGKRMWRLHVDFPKTKTEETCSVILEIFTIVQVELTRKIGTNKLEAKLLRPIFVG